MKLKKESGFTLVEIAIVLVVIGLLLGGILKGQQLINSARVRNLADQSSGIQAAYYGFIDRFRNLPGDMLNTAACTAIGTGIDAAGACATPGNAPGGTVGSSGGNGRIDTVAEAAGVWPHLSAAGFLNGTFTGELADGTALTATTYLTAVAIGAVPPNAFQGPIMLAHSTSYQNLSARGTVSRLVYSFGGKIPVPLLRDLDQKLDDGVAGSGVLRSAAESGEGSADAFGAIADFAAAGTCVTGATIDTWNVDSADQTCNAIFLY
jgi:prepilin-type N-terminal cleavage/methylation domain-containing protein